MWKGKQFTFQVEDLTPKSKKRKRLFKVADNESEGNGGTRELLWYGDIM